MTVWLCSKEYFYFEISWLLNLKIDVEKRRIYPLLAVITCCALNLVPDFSLSSRYRFNRLGEPRTTISDRLEASIELFMVRLFMYNAILLAITFTFVNGECLSLHANSRVMQRSYEEVKNK